MFSKSPKRSVSYAEIPTKVLEECFRQLGMFAVRHPWELLIIPTCFFLICLPGLLNIELDKSVDQFNARNSLAEKNRAVLDGPRNTPGKERTLPKDKKPKPKNCENEEFKARNYEIYVSLNNGDNILRLNYLDKLQDFVSEFRDKKIFSYKGQKVAYKVFCDYATMIKMDQRCVLPCTDQNRWLSEHRHYFDTSDNQTIEDGLQFPYVNIGKKSLDVSRILLGVELNGTQILGAKYVAFVFRLYYRSNETNVPKDLDGIVFNFWNQLSRRSRNTFDALTICHEHINEQTSSVNSSIVLAFCLSAIVFIFLITVSNFAKDPYISKPSESLLGCISTIFSIFSTLGLLSYFNCELKLTVIPAIFLVLLCGIRNCMLLISNWHTVDYELGAEERLGTTLEEVAPSVLLATFCQTITFAICAAVCDSSAVSGFCLFVCVGLILSFLFQQTFFIAVMAFGGEREGWNRYGIWCFRNHETEAFYEISQMQLEDDVVLRDYTFFHSTEFTLVTNVEMFHGTFVNQWLQRKFLPILLNQLTHVITFMFVIVYVIISLHGTRTIKNNPSLLLFIKDNSTLHEYADVIASRYLSKDAVKATVLIGEPPDLRHRPNQDRIFFLLKDLESSSYSAGRESTRSWFLDYLDFMNNPYPKQMKNFYNRFYLSKFSRRNPNSDENVRFRKKSTEICGNGDPCISAIKITTHFFNLTSWQDRKKLGMLMKDIEHKYKDLEISIDLNSDHLQSIDTVQSEIITCLGWSSITMIVICLAVVTSKTSAFFLLFNFLSCILGVFSGLSYWNCSLDQVTLGWILVSIGLALDLSIHVCYKFQTFGHVSIEDAMLDTFSALAWPFLQSIVLFTLSVSIVAAINAFAARVFCKAVLVMAFCGLVHTLLVILIVMARLRSSKREKIIKLF